MCLLEVFLLGQTFFVDLREKVKLENLCISSQVEKKNQGSYVGLQNQASFFLKYCKWKFIIEFAQLFQLTLLKDTNCHIAFHNFI